METAAAWTPTTPEMEAKVMFGRHIWDFAQHADALGKRMFELRQPPQHSVPPSVAYVALLDEVLAVEDTAGPPGRALRRPAAGRAAPVRGATWPRSTRCWTRLRW